MKRFILLSLKLTALIIVIFTLPNNRAYSQLADIKEELKSQLRYQQMRLNEAKHSVFGKGVEAYEAIKYAEKYLKENHIPVFDDEKEKHSLGDAVFAGGLGDRQHIENCIDKLQNQLNQIDRSSTNVQLPVQPLPQESKQQLKQLIDALKTQQKLTDEYHNVVERREAMIAQINGEIDRQKQLESIQQQAQPLSPQQSNTVQQIIDNLQERQQQQQQIQQQFQQTQQQQHQIQESTQPLPTHQTQNFQQIIDRIQQQQQQQQEVQQQIQQAQQQQQQIQQSTQPLPQQQQQMFQQLIHANEQQGQMQQQQQQMQAQMQQIQVQQQIQQQTQPMNQQQQQMIQQLQQAIQQQAQNH